MTKHFPEEPVNARSAPDTMNEHLRSTWQGIRNNIASDQNGITQNLDSIRYNKKSIRFLQARIVANLNALDALEGVR